jgi:hypothetical protein
VKWVPISDTLWNNTENLYPFLKSIGTVCVSNSF